MSEARSRWRPVLHAAVATGALLASLARADVPAVYERTTQKPIAQTIEDAEFAITERNFRITGSLHIGKAVRERDGVDFPDFEVILFCNLGYARQMLELEPGFINLCPGRVTIRSAGTGIVVSAPLLPQNTADSRLNELMIRLNALIREIVDYAAESWIQEIE